MRGASRAGAVTRLNAVNGNALKTCAGEINAA